MKTKLIVSLAAVLALLTAIPAAASTYGFGKDCSDMYGGPCDAGLVCQAKCQPNPVAGICAVKCPHTGPKRVVCGCNGQTYSDDCVRQQAGVSLAHEGKCK
jgi:hypothetical protein